MVTTDVVDKVLLLEFGADDYITKPFSPRELLARVRTAIRSTRKPITRNVAEFDGICVDFTGMEVNREGQPIALTSQEFKILKFFLHNDERDVLRDELLTEALGYHDYPSLADSRQPHLEAQAKTGKRSRESHALPHGARRRIQVCALTRLHSECAGHSGKGVATPGANS